jgi:hypothetical protein
MPKYIKIAPQESNLNGITSKGYIINKRGVKVYIYWGAIKSISRKFYWTGTNLPQTTVREFETLDEAMVFYKDKIRRINKQEYKQLPKGVTILKFRKKLV